MGTVTKHLGIPCDRTFETNLFAAEADPKKVRSARVLGKRFHLRKLEGQDYNGEPEGGKPSALYQNPGTISRFEKTMDLGPGSWGLGPWALGPGPRPKGPVPRARTPGPGAPGPGPRAQGTGPKPKVHRIFKTTYCARILI